jgi:hypothetical protein
LKVQQFSGRGEFLGENQVLKGEGKNYLALQPAVGNHLDEVEWVQCFEERDSELEDVILIVVLPQKLFLEVEVLAVQDLFTVAVGDEDPEGLRAAVD